MPWGVFKDGKRFCVHKLKDGGKKGERVACHSSRTAARRHMRALYANVNEMSLNEYGGSMGDHILRVSQAFNAQFQESIRDEAGNTLWLYVADVFEDFLVVRVSGSEKYFEVGYTATEESVTFEPQEDWTPVELSYTALTEMGPFTDVLVISEFRGRYPDVPVAEGIDIAELTDGDSEPVFVTLPIGKANVVSGNKRYYDDAFVQELEKQVLSNRPVGLMGHLSPEQRSTAFPAEAVHWVGAVRVGELLWGKGYVPPGEARKRLQRYKATKKPIATSIAAIAEAEWDSTLGAFRMKADTLKLEQIDIAPADRAGIPDLAAVPHFTMEMAESYEEDSMGKLEVIRELTAEDVPLLPEAVRKAILESAQPAPEVRQVERIREFLKLPAGVDPLSTIVDLHKTHEQFQEMQLERTLTELLNDAEKGIKVPVVQDVVAEMVKTRNPATVEQVREMYDQVVQSATVKALLSAAVTETMGPSQGSPLAPQKTAGRYFMIPGKEK